MTSCRKRRILKFILFVLFVFGLIALFYRHRITSSSTTTTTTTTKFRGLVDNDDPPDRNDDYQNYMEQGHVQNDLNANRIINAEIVVPFMDKTRLGNFEGSETRIERIEGPHFSSKSQRQIQKSIQTYGMNVLVSDEISFNRSIPDTRLDECRYWNYPQSLPEASVVIVFHNEGLSVLLRTVYSVLNRSPPEFLKEVLLVDDFSNKHDLFMELEYRIQNLQKVRLIRNPKREGLIRSRNRGAKEAGGVVVVFLDAHCEVNVNWLPPLLTPIFHNFTTMTVPIIDQIKQDTFEYRTVYPSGTHFRGIFEWGLLYKEAKFSKYMYPTRKYDSEPYPSPTHAGGLFAINRQYFLSLGLYDDGLLVWGGENFELSFKIWQCGGEILCVPCSRVGHVYRQSMPYDFGELTKGHKAPLITTNYKRVIEVWMDPKYKEYFYTREPLARFIDIGDISQQLNLKRKLNCKSFEWYLKNVAVEMKKEFPDLPPNLFWGKLINADSQECFSTSGKVAPTTMEMETCFAPTAESQILRLNTKGQLSNGERCIETGKNGVELIFCPSGSVSGSWEYKNDTQQLMHLKSRGCLDLTVMNRPKIMVCDKDKNSQKWIFRSVQPT